jgi:cytoskeletal protein RodZ
MRVESDEKGVPGLLEVGGSLRQRREAQGLTLADAEKATHVRARYLRALEEEQFDLLPGGSYPRVFLRDYASYLGLDPTSLLEDLPEPEPEISPQPVGLPLRPLPWRGAVATALVLGCAAAASFWFVSTRGHSPPAAVAQAAAPAAPKVVQRQAAPAAPAVAKLRAVRGDCWIRVTRGDRVLWVGTLRQGRMLELGVARRLVVRLGAPWNLDISLAGKPLRGLPHAPVNVTLAA